MKVHTIHPPPPKDLDLLRLSNILGKQCMFMIKLWGSIKHCLCIVWTCQIGCFLERIGSRDIFSATWAISSRTWAWHYDICIEYSTLVCFIPLRVLGPRMHMTYTYVSYSTSTCIMWVRSSDEDLTSRNIMCYRYAYNAAVVVIHLVVRRLKF